MPTPPDVIGAIGALLEPLLETLERVGWVQRQLFPPLAGRLADELAPGTGAVTGPLRAVEGLVWPDDLSFMRDRLVGVARRTVEIVAAFVGAARAPGDPMGVFRGPRRFAPGPEARDPVAPALEPGRRRV